MNACYLHSEQPSETVCKICAQPVCRACLPMAGERDRCIDCDRRVKRAQAARRRMAMVGLAMFLIIVGGGALLARTYTTELSTLSAMLRYGDGRLAALVAVVAGDPCDRDATLRLMAEYMERDELRAAVAHAEPFIKRCGSFAPVQVKLYAAHMRLYRYDAAIADADALIAKHPTDKDFRWWRGRAYEEKGDLEAAAADYREAITLEPAITNVPMNLAEVYERLHRPCDALRTLEQYWQRYPQVGASGGLAERTVRLAKQGNCDLQDGPAQAAEPPAKHPLAEALGLREVAADPAYHGDVFYTYAAPDAESAVARGLTLIELRSQSPFFTLYIERSLLENRATQPQALRALAVGLEHCPRLAGRDELRQALQKAPSRSLAAWDVVQGRKADWSSGGEDIWLRIRNGSDSQPLIVGGPHRAPTRPTLRLGCRGSVE